MQHERPRLPPEFVAVDLQTCEQKKCNNAESGEQVKRWIIVE
jgi:hypothetical protein